MELLSWGSRNPCYCEFWCPGKLSQSLYFVKRVFYRLIQPTSGRPRLYSPPFCLAFVWRISLSWPAASSWFLWPWAAREPLSSPSTRYLTVSPTSVCLAVCFLLLPLQLKDTRFLLPFPNLNILKSYSLKAVCLAHKYNYRNARIGHRRLVLRYVCPVLVLAIILNIPKVIVISPIGDILKNNYNSFNGENSSKYLLT